MTTFAEFFRKATDGYDPYPFQIRFASADELPHLLRAPTGAGKTATAVLGWSWRYFHTGRPTPRRLVYCLPMRVLVEQSAREAKGWISNLKLDVPVHVLMGGVDTEEWHLHPERPAVLIGTQDMLLSRALNRGYAASRFHWPIDFGLLNNDCLWIFDEPQLMASGVSTSAQLAGLRKALGTFGPCPSVWMSATLESGWLDTVDFRGKFSAEQLQLTDEDYSPDRPLYGRMTAEKTLAPLGIKLTKEADAKEAEAVARAVLTRHGDQPGTQTLVVLNTVRRAKAVYSALVALRKKADTPKLLLVHSRFRPFEREGTEERPGLNAQLQLSGPDAADRIIVATQVVEAGVDISARTLVTELAPWASIVQRIGRCNRTGRDGPGQVFWIDLDTEKQAPPYEPEDLEKIRTRLEDLAMQDVSPQALSRFRLDPTFPHTNVVRRRDLLDLFDTSPDLSGNDIDVSRFVRSDDDGIDVQLFWRDFADEPQPGEPAPHRKELCRAPVNEVRTLLTDGRNGFIWDYLERRWQRVESRQLRPGMTVMLPSSAGGYSTTLGWTGEPKPRVEPVPLEAGERQPEDATDSDPNSEARRPRTVAEHTTAVCRAVNSILESLRDLTKETRSSLATAARWHDAGKAHPVFRDAMRRLNGDPPEGHQWAKSGGSGPLKYERKHFRHELASALAVLGRHADWPFLIAYLIAAHHGKVRLSIRSLPGEDPPDNERDLYACGVVAGDEMPAVDLGGEVCPATKLDLSAMRLGDNSWASRALAMRDDLGPFRLAYLEAILRAADQRVSNAERKGETP